MCLAASALGRAGRKVRALRPALHGGTATRRKLKEVLGRATYSDMQQFIEVLAQMALVFEIQLAERLKCL